MKIQILAIALLVATAAQGANFQSYSPQEKLKILQAIRFLEAEGVLKVEPNQKIEVDKSVLEQLRAEGLIQIHNSKITVICVNPPES